MIHKSPCVSWFFVAVLYAVSWGCSSPETNFDMARAESIKGTVKDIDGWRKIKWGMSVAQVKNLYGDEAMEP